MTPVYTTDAREGQWGRWVRPVPPPDEVSWDDPRESMEYILYLQRRAEDYHRALGAGFSERGRKAAAGWGYG